jgi:NOL1/NOP2/sun family putative RNA methylase
MILRNSELAEYLENLLGVDLKNFLEADPELKSIRINTLKIKNLTESGILHRIEKSLKPLSFSNAGYSLLNEIKSLSQSIDFFKGYFAFQGASSQIPPIVLNPQPAEKVLDMAAAPGSKTTQIAALMKNKGTLILNDYNISRMQALNTNTQKTGMINHCVYYLAGERLGRIFPETFDKVLLDAPCTGLGTIATHKEVLGWWSYEKLKKLTTLQKQLLISAIKTVKVEGEIVYSTCSVAPEENELLLNEILDKYPVEIVAIDNKGLNFSDDGITQYNGLKLDSSLQNARRIWPHKHGMEGFFIARLKKNGTYYNTHDTEKQEYISTLDMSDPLVSDILENISEAWGINSTYWKEYRFLTTRKRIWMFNNEIKRIIKHGFTNGGLLLAEKRENLWKLTHQSVQFFNEKITGRRINISHTRLKTLFQTGSCPTAEEENGYYVMDYQNKPSAILYIQDKIIKIKLPHPFNIYESASAS